MVNFLGVSISADEVMDHLKQTIQLREICQQILTKNIVRRAAQARDLSVTSSEIQADVDRFRLSRRLERASDTLAWLESQLITSEDWEVGVRDRILAQKLADSLFAEEVEPYFVQHRLEFDQVLLYQIVVPYEQVAQEVYYQIEENEISFYEAAHLFDIQETRRLQCGYEGRRYRSSLSPEIAIAAFSGTIAQVMRPIQTSLGYHLLLVEELTQAELTPEIRQQITQHLFSDWLNRELIS
jgi:parvulin-like peptidyl-prolyl isomerase